MAAAQALAQEEGRSLWRSLTPSGVEARLPVPHFNVINGGAHAPNDLDFQEFMMPRSGRRTMADAVRAGAEIYTCCAGNSSRALSASDSATKEALRPKSVLPKWYLNFWWTRSRAPGTRPVPEGVMIALDPAANGFYRGWHVPRRWRDAIE